MSFYEDQFGVLLAARVSAGRGDSRIADRLHHLDLKRYRRGLPGPDRTQDGRCCLCGSDHHTGDSWGSYGGTTEGYIECLVCGLVTGWADLSAVV